MGCTYSGPLLPHLRSGALHFSGLLNLALGRLCRPFHCESNALSIVVIQFGLKSAAMPLCVTSRCRTFRSFSLARWCVWVLYLCSLGYEAHVCASIFFRDSCIFTACIGSNFFCLFFHVTGSWRVSFSLRAMRTCTSLHSSSRSSRFVCLSFWP